ncbi:MAG: hypothetical protein QOK37_886 [Thermoanaerobaculia bacterium]|jgi:hypothetical protein|nr:hypothetical protein [Thermoanaerobaculia bacterium]
MTVDKTAEARLLANIKQRLGALELLLDRARSHWGYEDSIYRFYHQSFKVFGVQSLTTEIVAALRDLLPDVVMNRSFLAIIAEGTGKTFSMEMNAAWDPTTRPLLEAFFHARFMLEMAIKYGRELDAPPETLPSGWAAVLYLYGLR